ncbi:MAG: class D sortase [Peptococcaceae bacterium]|jgi:sortase A|nr:class D sortase [Peptococcaceae bacterium]
MVRFLGRLGWTVTVLGAAILLATVAFLLWGRVRQNQLRVATAALVPGASLAGGGWDGPPPAGKVMGLLVIPSLGLRAAFVQGTGFSQLGQAPGHLAGSTLPGLPGTAVIAAHNLTFFRHLDRLHRGQVIQVYLSREEMVFRVRDQAVIREGAALANTPYSSLVLETCYPLDALNLTPWRYVVTARLAGVRSGGGSGSPPGTGAAWPTVLPRGLARRFPLGANGSGVPMGRLGYAAPDTPAVATWQESEHPLAVEEAWVHLFVAQLDLARRGDASVYGTLFRPGAPARVSPFWLARRVVFGRGISVTIGLDSAARLRWVRGTVPVAVRGTGGWRRLTFTLEARPDASGRLALVPPS